jgi:hypothetical protein
LEYFVWNTESAIASVFSCRMRCCRCSTSCLVARTL